MIKGTTPAIAFILGVVALHCAAVVLPPSLTWGFHFLKFLSPMFPLAYVLTAALLVIAAVRGNLDPAVGRLAAWSQRPALFVPAALAAFLAAGFVFRVHVPLLGDSWYLVHNFAGALRGTEEALPRDEPLATWYLSTVLGLLGVRNYGEFLGAFFAGGMFLGVLFVLTAYSSAGLLFDDPRHRAIAFLTACFLPAAILFFGYVETYAVVLLMVALFAFTGLLWLRKGLRFWVVAVVFLAQVLTHYLTVLTLPAFVYLAVRGVKDGRRRDVALGTGVALLLALGILLAVGFDVTNYVSQVPHRHYLPLLTPQDPAEVYTSPYTLLSPFHLLDLANLAVLLLTPAAGIAIIGLGAGRARRNEAGAHAAAGHSDGAPGPQRGPSRTGDDPHPHDLAFLLLAAVPPFLFGCVAKFDLGMARDWDVLAPFSYIVLLVAFAWTFRRVPGIAGVRGAALIAVAAIVQSSLWWTVTASVGPAVARFRSLMDERLTAQAGMYSANLYLSRYYRQAGIDERESAELWLRYILLYPGDIRGFRNVLTNTRTEGAAAAADKIRGWSRAFGQNPLTDRTMVELAVESGNESLGANALDDAEQFYRAAIDIEPGSAAAWNNLGTVNARRDRFEEAADQFSRAVGIDRGFSDAWFNLGRAWLATGRVVDARGAFEEAAKLGNRSAKSLLSTGTVSP